MDEKTIFLHALDLESPQERAAYLHEACAGDIAVLGRVESLLMANRQAGDFLEEPVCRVGSLLDHMDPPASDPHSAWLSLLRPSERADAIGQFAQYDVLTVLGSGGSGVVFKAHDPALRRDVALKVLAPAIAADDAARKRFLREARATAAVHHRNVIGIHTVDEWRGLPYLIMPCIPGGTLRDRIERDGALDADTVYRLAIQIARGLAAAHACGLIHRDVKPANILLDAGDEVRITDFGLAKAADDAGMTQAGYIGGTPMFMSPEQAQGRTPDPRSDLFSLGSVLYVMCTGRPPFHGDTSLAVIRQVCDTQPAPVTEINRRVPEHLATIINCLLAKNPDDRFQSADEVVQALEHPHNSKYLRPKRGPRRRALVAAAALVGVCAVGLWTWSAMHGRATAPVGPTVVAAPPVATPTTLSPAPVTPAPAPTPPPLPSATEILTSDEWHWTEPVNIGLAVNGPRSLETAPFLAADSLTLYFTRFIYPPAPESQTHRDIWISKRAALDQPFGESFRLRWPVNTESDEEGAVVTPDNLTMIVSSDRPGGFGNIDLWMFTRKTTDDVWSNPVNLGPEINSPESESGVWMSSDGLLLLYCHHGDLYTCTRPDTSAPWGKRVSLGPSINSPLLTESDGSMTADRLVLFFSAISRPEGGGMGNYDIWMSTRASVDEPFTVVRNVGAPINTRDLEGGPIISPDGTTLIYHARRAKATFVTDLWMVRRVRRDATTPGN